MSIGNLHMLLGTQLNAVSGEIEFTASNGYTGVSTSWIVPPGVFYISVACIGGGGGGGQSFSPTAGAPSTRPGGGGGGGGGLSFDNYLPVTPGERISVSFGGGGHGGGEVYYGADRGGRNLAGAAGGNSRVAPRSSSTNSWSVIAGGGGGGAAAFWEQYSSSTTYYPPKYTGGRGGSGGTGDTRGGFGGTTAQRVFPLGGGGNYLQAGGSGGGPGGWGGAQQSSLAGRGYGIDEDAAGLVIIQAALGQFGGGGGGGYLGNLEDGAYGNFTSWPYLGTGGGIGTRQWFTPPNAPGAGGPGAHAIRGLLQDGAKGRAGRVRIMWDGPSGPKRIFPYGLSPVITSASSVDEGSSITFNVATSNVPNGTVLYWDTSRPEDFTTNSGSFVVNNNSASFSITPTLDAITEGPEAFTVNVWWGSVSGKLLAISDEVIINNVELPAPSQADYLVPGSYSFVVPAGLTTISAVVVGGGGGGGGGAGAPSTGGYYGQGGSGGGGGGLSYGTFAVTPGETLSINVGSGGSGGTNGSSFNGSGTSGSGGAFSSIRRSTVWVLRAGGGSRGLGGTGVSSSSFKSGGLGAAGSTYAEAYAGGGTGGRGGNSRGLVGAGGGGAAGYSGNGGQGGGSTSAGQIDSATNGSGGGGAGGDRGEAIPTYTEIALQGHFGGDVGITGQGSNGFTSSYGNGGIGSPSSVADAGRGGGGGGGAGKNTNGNVFLRAGRGMDGSRGAVRIIWGDPTINRQYPSTNIQDV